MRALARVAAWRFAARRVRIERNAWLPLSLRWRQRRRPLTRVYARNAAARVTKSITWFPQFHLHFATHLTTRSGGQAIVSVLVRTDGTGRIAFPPLLVHRHWTTIREAAFRSQSDSFLTRVIHCARPKTFVTTDAHTVLHAATNAQLISRRSLFETSRSSVSTHAARETHTHSSSRDRTLLRLRDRRAAIHVEKSRSSERTIFTRKLELVYRRGSRPRTEPEIAAEVRPASALSLQSPVAEQQAAIPSAATRAALQAPAIDLDRLTDDVIRRVERRVRIERERRGL
jgi:hypothetical protein